LPLPAAAATATATVAIIAAAAATTATAVTGLKSTAAAKPALRLWPCLVHVQSAAIQVGPIELSDCCFRFTPIGHFNKGESAGLTAIAVGDDVHALDCTKLLKRGLEISLGGLETQVPNENIGHEKLLFRGGIVSVGQN
jgi:hypothetical protein